MAPISSPLSALLAPLSEHVLRPLIGRACADAVVTLDLARGDCFRLLLSRTLSLAIVAGAAVLKLPQIANIVVAGSAAGLSFASFYIETAAIAITVAYNYRSGSPFSAYGEGVLINLQNIVLLALILAYQQRPAKAASVPFGALAALSALAALAVGVASEALVGRELLRSLQWGTIVLGIASKLPQIWSNYASGSTGQLSAATALLQFVGTLARIYTSINERLDSTILASFAVAAVLNGVLLAQIVASSRGGSHRAARPKDSSHKEPAKTPQKSAKAASSSSSARERKNR